MSLNSRAQSAPTSRVFAVLEVLATHPNDGLTLSEIARSADLSTSTTAAILVTMDDATYVERLPNKAYRLGPGLLRLLAGLRARYPLLGAADDELSRLTSVVGCGCTLARLGAENAEVVLTVGAVDEFHTRVGHRMPLYPPHGSLAVAWRSPQEIDEWLSSAPEPLTDEAADKLRNSVAEIRERGYAVYSVDHDARTTVDQIRDLLGQFDDHPSAEALRSLLLTGPVGMRIYTTVELAARRRRPVSYVIAPVFGPDRQPRYLASIHVMRDAVPADDLDRYVGALLHAARALSPLDGGHFKQLPASTGRVRPVM